MFTHSHHTLNLGLHHTKFINVPPLQINKITLHLPWQNDKAQTFTNEGFARLRRQKYVGKK